MCLRLLEYKKNSILFKVAKEDITCYKLLLRIPPNSLYTAYRGFPVEGEYLKAKGLPNIKRSRKGYYLEEGVIHSFANLPTAHLAALLHDCNFANSVIYECIIPKGTLYCEGLFDDYRSYGSKQIKLIKNVSCNRS